MEFNKTEVIALLVVSVLFVFSVVSALQLNSLSEKVNSMQKTQPVSFSAQTSSSNSASDEAILEKLNSAPDMVGGC